MKRTTRTKDAADNRTLPGPNGIAISKPANPPGGQRQPPAYIYSNSSLSPTSGLMTRAVTAKDYENPRGLWPYPQEQRRPSHQWYSNPQPWKERRGVNGWTSQRAPGARYSYQSEIDLTDKSKGRDHDGFDAQGERTVRRLTCRVCQVMIQIPWIKYETQWEHPGPFPCATVHQYRPLDAKEKQTKQKLDRKQATLTQQFDWIAELSRREARCGYRAEYKRPKGELQPQLVEHPILAKGEAYPPIPVNCPD